LFYGSKDLDFCLWDLLRQVASLKTDKIKGRCFAFSPDGHCLALAQYDGPILVYELPSGRCTNRLEQADLPYSVTFSPDGRRLAVSSKRSAQVRDLETGALLQSFPHPDLVFGLAWHPAGNLLATGCGDQNIRIWDAEAQTMRSVLAGHQATVVTVAFDHSGDLLASTSFDMTMRLWDTHNWHLAATKTGANANARAPFTADDRRLGYSSGGTKLGICNVAPGIECRQLWLDPELTGNTEACDFSPDGRVLVSAHSDGARVWDLAAS